MAVRTFARLASAGQGRRLFLLSWVAYAAAYVGRYNYSAVMSAITAEGTLTLSAAGAVSTGYFVCYAAGQILCGILSQKASPFGMIPLGAALATWGIGTAAEGFGWGAVFVLWAVMAGTALAVCLLLARPWGRFVRKCEMERGDLV